MTKIMTAVSDHACRNGAQNKCLISGDILACSLPEGECISGALWWEDLIRLAEEVGFCTPRLVTASVITVDNPELEKLLGKISLTDTKYK